MSDVWKGEDFVAIVKEVSACAIVVLATMVDKVLVIFRRHHRNIYTQSNSPSVCIIVCNSIMFPGNILPKSRTAEDLLIAG